LDIRERQWCEPLVEFIGSELGECLPTVASSRRAIGLLTEQLREAWGLSSSPIISAGGGDNMMGAIGTGNVQPGVVTVSLGTSGTVFAFSAEPVIDPEGEVAAFCDSTDRWMPLVCTMNVTVATEQVRKLFGWTHEELEAQIRTVGAGSGGLLFLPYLNGERTPNLPKGTGVYHGLTSATMAPAHMACAVMEGVTLGLAYGLNRFRQLGIEPAEIRLTGGGSKSAIWRQVCADVFGVPTVCLQSAEGAALGAALQAAYTAANTEGKPIPYRELVSRLVLLDEQTRCEPDEENHAVYSRALGRQTDLTHRLQSASYL
jgi:xylulokinase